MSNDDALRYPTGRFAPKEVYTSDELRQLIDKIEAFPDKLESEAGKLSDGQLDTPYREGGWTVRQVIHHISDSHMNAYIRLKWTLTEDNARIKAYNEKAWAETPETKLDPRISIALLKTLHVKWVSVLRSLKPEDFERSFLHPETGKLVSLARQVATYAWHGEHHLGHIRLVSAKAD
jgi:DinB superfamily